MSTVVDETVTPGRAASASRPAVWLTDASLVLMAVIWGVNFSVVKYGTGLVDPLAYNGIRVAMAAVVLLVIAAAGSAPFPPRRTILALLGLGVLGNGIYQFFFVEGVARASASDASLVVAASPALIAIISRLRGIERVRPRAALGIALSIVGIGFVVAGSVNEAHGHASLFGDLLVLLGSIAWAVYTVLLKPHTERVPGLQLAAITMVGGAVPLFIVAWPAISTTHWSALPSLGWAAICYSGMLALVVAYLFWYNGVRVLGPTRTAMYSNLQPVVAVLFAWGMLGEQPTSWEIVGAASIMGGLLLTRT